jgi:hypothetical protein
MKQLAYEANKFAQKSVRSLVFALASVAAFLTFLFFLTTVHFNILFFLSIFIILISSIRLGQMILSGCNEDPELFLSWLVGSSCLSVSLVILAKLFAMPITYDFFILAAFVEITSYFTKGARSSKIWEIKPIHGITLCIAAIGTVLWSQENLRGSQTVGEKWISYPWQDIFYHAVQVSKFANVDFSNKLQSQVLAGLKPESYHYASYQITALVARLTNLSRLDLTYSLYPVYGFFLMSIAAFAVANRIFGKVGGYCAVVAVCLLPDPSFYGLGSPWTSFFFFQEVGIAGTYAVATLAAAWIIALSALADEHLNFRKIALSTALVLLAAMFKFQIALAYGLALPVFFILSLQNLSTAKKIGWLSLVFFFYGLGNWVLHLLPGAPFVSPSLTGGYLELQNISDTCYARPLLAKILRHLLHSRLGVLTGVFTEPLLQFGILFPAFIWLLIQWSNKTNPLRKNLIFPLIIFLNYLFISLCIRQNFGRGDPYEIIHKTFVWPYFVLAVSTAGGLGFFVETKLNRRSIGRPISVIVFCGMICVFSALDFFLGSNLQTVFWKGTTQISLPKDLVESALYIQSHHENGDKVEIGFADPYLAVLSLTEIPAFYDRTEINAPPLSSEESERKIKMESALAFDTQALVNESANLGIQWWIIDTRNSISRTTASGLQVKPFGNYQVFHLQQGNGKL